MRLLIDTVVALMLVALLGGVVWHTRADQAEQQNRDAARAEVRRFQQQITLQTALARVQNDEQRVVEIDPEWFGGRLPINPLLSASHPWLEIAGPDEKQLIHPRQCVATSPNLAQFWFNPHTGIIRARVPVAISDAAAMEMYTYINECAAPELFAK